MKYQYDMFKRSSINHHSSFVMGLYSLGPITVFNDNDVLCGRGGYVNNLKGNRQFQDIVRKRKKEYLDVKTKKLEKVHIASSIVKEIRQMNPPGRFLKEDFNTGLWFDIGDEKAIKKTGQALREGATRVVPPISGSATSKCNISKDNKKEERQDLSTKPQIICSNHPHTDAELNAKEIFRNAIQRIQSQDGTSDNIQMTKNKIIVPPANINVNDVLCGRGSNVNNHFGNIRFRSIVKQRKNVYLSSKKLEKSEVAASVVQDIRNMKPPGRFLKQDSLSGTWYDIGNEKALKKTGQAFREIRNKADDATSLWKNKVATKENCKEQKFNNKSHDELDSIVRPMPTQDIPIDNNDQNDNIDLCHKQHGIGKSNHPRNHRVCLPFKKRRRSVSPSIWSKYEMMVSKPTDC